MTLAGLPQALQAECDILSSNLPFRSNLDSDVIYHRTGVTCTHLPPQTVSPARPGLCHSEFCAPNTKQRSWHIVSAYRIC